LRREIVVPEVENIRWPGAGAAEGEGAPDGRCGL